MGLYTGNLGSYYANPSGETLGGYQFISLTDIINNFRIAYVGEDKIISKINRADIKFHAMRGIQELSYDTFRSCKTLELEVPPNLLLPIPHDYVEYVKLTWTDSAGHCHTIQSCKTCPKDPLSYKQHKEDDRSGKGLYEHGDIVVGDSPRAVQILVSEGYRTWVASDPGEGKDNEDTKGYWVYTDAVYRTEYVYDDPIEEPSETWATKSSGGSSSGEGDPYQANSGGRYGLDPQHANVNGCFWINCRTGKIHFDSNLAGKTVIIQYISDGLATDDEMIVHKFAEEAMYKHIAHAILNTRSNTDANLVARYKKERFATVRNAKIRLSSIKLEEITQIMRGKSKWIKH